MKTYLINGHEVMVQPYRGLPCRLEIFFIDGKKAWLDDFGDSEGSDDGDYGCEQSRFFLGEFSKDIRKKYNITFQDFQAIGEVLEKELAVNACGWCS